MTATMKCFAKRRDVFRAAQWTGAWTPDVEELVGERRATARVEADQQLALGRGWYARVGDWLYSMAGEDLSVMSDDQFRKIYEEVDEAGRVWPTAEEHERAGREFMQELDALLLVGLRVSREEHVAIFRDRDHLMYSLRRLLEDHAYVAAQRELARIRTKINKEL